jgi:hypothetical protein
MINEFNLLDYLDTVYVDKIKKIGSLRFRNLQVLERSYGTLCKTYLSLSKLLSQDMNTC